MKTTQQDNTIDAPEEDYLYTDISQIPNAGKGLYTAITIYKDEIICLFKGEVLTEQEAKKRADGNNAQYFIKLLNGSIMDSINTACFAKFANDAEGNFPTQFKNNAKITLDEDNNICLVALKKIKAGEEIFTAYGKKYWEQYTM